MGKVLMLSLVAATALATLPGSSRAQNVRDLTGHQPTQQEFIDSLKPPPGTGHHTRGIEMAPAAKPGNPEKAEKPQCKPFKVSNSRGIGPVSTAAQPVAMPVAMKVEFATNSAELTPPATKTLDELGKALTSDELKSYCFVVEGHTDSRGSDALNLKLSEHRAQSVVHYLVDHFKIDEDRLQAVGYGKSKPIADNATEEGRQKNRRVQVANLGA
jgi:OOP family OmpA-OmpF porin